MSVLSTENLANCENLENIGVIFHDPVYSYRPGLIVHKDKKDNKNMFTGTAQISKFLLIISKKNIYKYSQMLNIQMGDPHDKS